MNNNLIICFLGMDGSGKSTLSTYLYGELLKRDYSVSHKWWLEGEDSFVRKFIRKIGKNSDINSSKTIEGKSSQKNIYQRVYTWIVLLDYLRFGFITVTLPNLLKKNQIMIFDRYYYDVIFALSKEFNFSSKQKSRLFKIFSNIILEPDLIYYIEVTPEISYSRKKSEIKNMANAESIYNDYQQLVLLINHSLNVSNVLEIDNSDKLESVKSKIFNGFINFIEEKYND
jgi:thymidylate kinase